MSLTNDAVKPSPFAQYDNVNTLTHDICIEHDAVEYVEHAVIRGVKTRIIVSVYSEAEDMNEATIEALNPTTFEWRELYTVLNMATDPLLASRPEKKTKELLRKEFMADREDLISLALQLLK